ncbi:hypothetical protein Sjap_019119 [Stephania japonica]|uniref:Uncharacterized protein n=1 Tax=Stephania japonica TaxID=461633 RepID=A0AAP0HZ77_9MAGN
MDMKMELLVKRVFNKDLKAAEAGNMDDASLEADPRGAWLLLRREESALEACSAWDTWHAWRGRTGEAWSARETTKRVSGELMRGDLG